jgi:DNA-directed RNA polymerase sigma subunit (sigma70/sigma32)
VGEVIHLSRGLKIEDLPDSNVDVAEEAILAADLTNLRHRVARLPQPERAVIEWRYGVGRERLTHREVAGRLRVSLGKAWKIEQSGVALLREGFDLGQAA